VQAFAPVTAVLVGGRLIVGAAVGLISVAAPLYGAELAPRTLRGRIVSGYQFAITIGIFAAYLVNDWLSAGGSWRVMLGLPRFWPAAAGGRGGGAGITALADEDAAPPEAKVRCRRFGRRSTPTTR